MDVVEVMTAADNLEEAIHSGQATRKLRKRNSLSALVVVRLIHTLESLIFLPNGISCCVKLIRISLS